MHIYPAKTYELDGNYVAAFKDNSFVIRWGPSFVTIEARQVEELVEILTTDHSIPDWAGAKIIQHLNTGEYFLKSGTADMWVDEYGDITTTAKLIEATFDNTYGYTVIVP